MLEPDNADVDKNNTNKNNKATSFEFVSFSGNDNYKNELDFVIGNYGHEVTQHELNSVILADSIACISFHLETHFGSTLWFNYLSIFLVHGIRYLFLWRGR